MAGLSVDPITEGQRKAYDAAPGCKSFDKPSARGTIHFMLATLFHDLRFGFRSFLRIPGFTLTAVLSLAIGIGANSSVFSVIDALLLHALPYKDSDRLVILWNRSPGLNITQDWFSTAQYFDIKAAQQSFADVAIAIGGVENLTRRKLSPPAVNFR